MDKRIQMQQMFDYEYIDQDRLTCYFEQLHNKQHSGFSPDSIGDLSERKSDN